VIYDGADRWAAFTYYDGLVSDQVRSFSDTESWIWIGCYGGVNRVDKAYLNNVRFNRHVRGGDTVVVTTDVNAPAGRGRFHKPKG
jgi:ligand-binding sensor domain-containing protein